MNHERMTYEDWVDWMTIKIDYDGRRWHNYAATKDWRYCVENWITGERVWLDLGADVSFQIPVDIRYIPTGNRNYSDQMWPEYLEIGADKWEIPTPEERGWKNRPPPIET